jgi:hypothetical protein
MIGLPTAQKSTQIVVCIVGMVQGARADRDTSLGGREGVCRPDLPAELIQLDTLEFREYSIAS